ncbi:hypothetical protein FACS189432_05750 [Bacteroidia bacterium]|nr:hypothetical protein FACS189432_05750 [Bacteroidia bacterium]
MIAAAFVVVVVILLLFIIHYNRRIAKKNRNLVARLKEQDKLTEMNMQADTDSASTEQTDESNARQLLRNLHAWLLQDARYAGKIDANTLAAALTVSRTRLFETVKALTGKTLQDYINALRLDQARQMLETTTATVETIATDCGFSTVRTFYRLFRESYGMTPAQYRKIVMKS